MRINGNANRPQVVAFALALVLGSGLNAAEQPVQPASPDPLKQLWSFALPLKRTTAIESYHLLDGYVYAIGSDGKVRCVRADNGEFMWTTQVGRPADVIWPPINYRSSDFNGVGFATLEEVVFLDQQSGFVTKRFELASPLAGGLAAANQAIFVTGVDRSVTRYDIADGWPRWRIATRDVLRMPPVFLWAEDLVVTADEGGRITAADSTRRREYIIKLEGSPRGWLAVDSGAIYVATANDAPRLYALDRRTGKAMREPYRLSGPPRGGPVVTARSIYQATMPRGLHRVGLTGDVRNWYHTSAKQFLAEWPSYTAILTEDGRIHLVDAQGEAGPIAVLTNERYVAGVSNPYNDAVIVATDQGQIRCFRPTGAPPLDVKTFHPTTQPAQTQPAEANKPPEQSNPATILTTVRPRAARPAPAPANQPPAQPAAQQPQLPRLPQLPPGGQNEQIERLKRMLENSFGPQPQPQNRPGQERPR